MADDEPTPEAVTNAVESAETPLEESEPVTLEEVDDDGEQPPDSWGQQGAGGDAEREDSDDGEGHRGD